MKVSFYELLGMVKEGKAPKKIKEKFSDGFQEQYFLDEEGWYTTLDGTSKMNIFKVDRLNDEVEIIEEDKKIEKLNKMHFHKKQRQLANKINEIIDKLNEMSDDV